MYCQQVDLVIQQDWSRTKTVMNKLRELETRATQSQYGLSTHYDLGALGTISKHSPSQSWYRISSTVINQTMPWLAGMLAQMQELLPDEGCISVMFGPGAEHIDVPEMKTALNYIFDNSDPSAYTWVKHNEHYETYPSDINTAWILDTQKLHGIENTGERWSLSIHFNAEYDKVKQWFDNNPSLIFGKTHNEY